MTQELKAQEKRTMDTEGESTRPGPVFVPAVDIFESDKGMTLVADMPGVEKEDLTVDLKDNMLTIKGRVKRTENQPKVLYREYEVGDYFRQFTVSEVIDQAGIAATLKNGVLTLKLPKVAPAQPRKIEVSAE